MLFLFWLKNFSHYFNDGQVGSEPIDYFGIINENNRKNISGSGYFRFVYEGENYVLHYKIIDGKIKGKLR